MWVNLWRLFVSIGIVIGLAAFIGWQRWTLRRRSCSVALSRKELSAMADEDVLTALENLLMFEEQFTSAGYPGSSAEAQVYDSGACHQTAQRIALLRAEVTRRGMSL